MVRRHLVLRVVSKLLIPFILLFALYVQFHGDFGPGGGFQAGVIFGAGFILYALIEGIEVARRVAPTALVRLLMVLGLLLYVGVGYVGLFKGANFLNYDVLAHDPVHGQELGIFLVELGVGITVAATMVTIFFAFVDQARR
ncbi:MAG: Na(+)/H(+) antiporter subunit B [Alphaproteobacteria bacterium]|nr:MAG: Na(+)/H(+) antiporter subunit B [Alphaproteobacteria bacterium]